MLKIALATPQNDGSDMGLYNLMALATYIKNKLDCDVKIFDYTDAFDYAELHEFNPDIFGITVITYSVNRAKKIAVQVKERLKVPVIIGGVHISSLPQTLDYPFDIGVIGEGEETFLDIINTYCTKSLLEPSNLSTIPGIVYKNKNKIIMTEPRGLIKPLDSIPIPDRSLISKKYFKAKKIYKKSVRQAGMMTSRGCPYKCSFCASSFYWNKTRFFPVEQVVDEIEYLYRDFDINSIVFWDDTFTLNLARIEKMIDLLEKKKLIGKISFSCHPRANKFDNKTAELLKRMGVRYLAFGFESGSDNLLARIKPAVTLEQNKKAALLAKNHDFFVTAFIMLANPEETIEDMKETLAFMTYLHNISVDCCMVFCASPLPGSDYWKYAESKKIVSGDMNFNSLVVDDLNNPILLDPAIDLNEYLKIVNEATIKSKSFGLGNRYSRLDLIAKGMKNPRLGFNISMQLVRARLGK